MRQFILGGLLLLLAGTALAEDVSAIATGSTKLKACSNAKAHAERKCDSSKVETFYECDCETGSYEGGDEHQCSVNATCSSNVASTDRQTITNEADEANDE